MTPSCRFPLRAGGTEPLRGSPREAGGTYGGGAIRNFGCAISITKKEGKRNLPPSLSWLDAQCLTDRRLQRRFEFECRLQALQE
jgi:hypothetical protein